METLERTSVGWPTRCKYDSRVMCKRQMCFTEIDMCPEHPVAKQILVKGPNKLQELEALVEIQGEILAAMSRNNSENPDVLEIQCALSREHGKNLAAIWKLRGEI